MKITWKYSLSLMDESMWRTGEKERRTTRRNSDSNWNRLNISFVRKKKQKSNRILFFSSFQSIFVRFVLCFRWFSNVRVCMWNICIFSIQQINRRKSKFFFEQRKSRSFTKKWRKQHKKKTLTNDSVFISSSVPFFIAEKSTQCV